MTKLNCQACADFIADYLNGDLDAEVLASFETHLDRCRNCRAYIEQYAVVVKAGQREHPPARDAPEQVVADYALVGPSSSTGPWRRAIT
jgi:predicted anti-sigma-YlaC factor YlaD